MGYQNCCHREVLKQHRGFILELSDSCRLGFIWHKRDCGAGCCWQTGPHMTTNYSSGVPFSRNMKWWYMLTRNARLYVWYILLKADSRLAPSQWEMMSQSNAISFWVGAKLESALLLPVVIAFVLFYMFSFYIGMFWYELEKGICQLYNIP